MSHPAVAYTAGNLVVLARRTEQQRQEQVSARLHEVIRSQPRRQVEPLPVSQYAATDKVVRRGLWILVGLAVIGHMLAGLPQ